MRSIDKYFILVFFVIIFNLFSFPQKNKIDSLLTLIKKSKDDTTKVKYLNNLGWLLKDINPDTSITLSRQALTISAGTKESLKWKKGIANSLGNLGVYYKIKGNYSDALNYFTKALKIDEELNNKKGIASRLSNIGNVYLNQANYPKTLEYYLKTLKLADEMGDKQLQAINKSNLGNVYSDQMDYQKALQYFFRSSEIRRRNKR